MKSELDSNSQFNIGQAIIPTRKLAEDIYRGIRVAGGGETYRSFTSLVFDLGLPIDLMIQSLHMNYDEEKNYFNIFMMSMRFLAPYAVETG